MKQPKDQSRGDWRPTASLDALRVRAEVLTAIRAFFAERQILEVETPALAATAVTDVHLKSLSCPIEGLGTLHLQTSPEFHMKRLLAAGCGPIFQICRAFRDGESGRRHNPEFTILEWYRPGWDHHDLMVEIDALLTRVLGTTGGEQLTYRQVFLEYAGIDPHDASDDELRQRVANLGIQESEGLDRDDLLNLILTHVVEGELGKDRPAFVHDFPISQASLARIRNDDPPVAERFEVFVDGLELANGFHELTDADEQRRRFNQDLAGRRRAGLALPRIDERFLAALENGLPPCAGVAMGVDRLIMLKLGTRDISHVIAFPIDRA